MKWLRRLLGYRTFSHKHSWNKRPDTERWDCECGAHVVIVRTPKPTVILSAGMFSMSDVAIPMALLQADVQVGIEGAGRDETTLK